MDTEELNIQPEASILEVFSNLSYKVWYAIAEFVDNSTQSFYSNEEMLKEHGINSVNIEINYDICKNELTITDDAFGMEYEDFVRAIKLDSKPHTTGTRNEFGMGLKTAASWFGFIWSVQSTQYGSDKEYKAEVDIHKLKEKRQNSITIMTTKCERKKHGTKIVIKDISKKIAPATRKKVCTLLQSMYRRDLNSGKVNISFDGEKLSFKKYAILTWKDRYWKEDVDFSFLFDEKKYHVTGFVGILAEGSGFDKAGFALFRRDRVVIGGEGQNYKPDKIFIQAQSPISHKLFGELNLDNFPINQAKDGFVWDYGLEDEFVKQLRLNIDEYIRIAKKTNKERVKEEQFTQGASDKIHNNVSSFTKKLSDINSENSEIQEEQDTASDLNPFDEYLNESNKQSESVFDCVRPYTVNIDSITKRTYNIRWSIANDNGYWITTKSVDEKTVDVIINVNHQFFKPYINEQDFQIIIEKFVIAFLIAEDKAKQYSECGLVKPNAIRNELNRYLSEIARSEMYGNI
ncbi:MAG: hypothetical protein HDR36_07710 [Treponema sp.]|nr:hypothetical protein [Treponema sp.]